MHLLSPLKAQDLTLNSFGAGDIVLGKNISQLSHVALLDSSAFGKRLGGTNVNRHFYYTYTIPVSLEGVAIDCLIICVDDKKNINKLFFLFNDSLLKIKSLVSLKWAPFSNTTASSSMQSNEHMFWYTPENTEIYILNPGNPDSPKRLQFRFKDDLNAAFEYNLYTHKWKKN